MDFNQLLARMQELDRPVAETVPAAENCGGPMSMPPSPSTPPVTPPSMSVNLNAQGMDNIEDLLKLITKVNPDMGKPELPPLPSLSMPPSITSIKPAMPPLKMLPDMDGDNDDKPGGEMDADYNDDGKLDRHEKDHADEKPLLKTLDKDKDGDHDMDDHDLEKKKEGFQDATTEPNPEYQDTDYMVNKLAGGMNGPKKMYKHSYKQGDNPMAMEGEELRAWVKSELKQRLEEVKSR
jgi:hypothetical protein